MQNILTLIAPTLDDAIVRKYADALEGQIEWLCEGQAADISFDGNGARLVAELEGEKLDFAFQENSNRRKKLLVADMDSTIIQCECIDELADFAGLKERISAITEAAMQGELDFEEALRERVALLKGMDVAILERVFNERVKLMPGATALIKTMNAHGANTVLISGGFTYFTSRVAEITGFQVNRGNILAIEDGKLSGEVESPIVDSSTKINSLIEFRDQGNLSEADTMAVGDGANDIPMIRGAGLGIAYHPKPAAAEAADVVIRHNDLRALLYLQGYRADEIILT